MWLPLEEQVLVGCEGEQIDAAPVEGVIEEFTSEVYLRVVAEASLELVEIGLAIGIAVWFTVGEVGPTKVTVRRECETEVQLEVVRRSFHVFW